MRSHHQCGLHSWCGAHARHFASSFGEEALRAALAAPAGNRTADRFEALGGVVQCPERLLQVLGRGDDEKRVCADLDHAHPCVVVSIGSNNQWGFEEAVTSRFPHCRVETFDCTVAATVPASLRSRVRFHPWCIGVSDGPRELSWSSVVRRLGLTGAPAALKADVEGFEWDVFDAIARSGAALLPFSISVEVHLWTEIREVRWQGRWRRPEETAAWMETLRSVGYALVDRHDNPLCGYCSEITLARIAPPRGDASGTCSLPPPPAAPATADCAAQGSRTNENQNRRCRSPALRTTSLLSARDATPTRRPLVRGPPCRALFAPAQA